MNPKLIASVLLLASPITPVIAAETPSRGELDPRVREVAYNPNQVYRITGVFKSATQILFGSRENITHVALGDTVSWEVAPAGNMLFLKPREYTAGHTNLIVTTTGPNGPRHYTMELRARRGGIGVDTNDTFFKVRFRYPDQEDAERERAKLFVAQAQAEAIEDKAIESALDIGVIEGFRNVNYTVQGASAIQPSEITDNGRFTVLRFPAQREIPAIFSVAPDRSEQIVPFDVRDDFVVVHGIYRELRLRRGGVVLCIYNEAQDYYGVDYQTDTASPRVERNTNGETN